MNMTKEESIRWINHAIAFYESLDKKKKDLAKDLGIEASRLSELQNINHSSRVTPNMIRQIIELCGAPKRDPGRFEYAELYDSLESFFDNYIPVTLNRYYRDIYESLTDKAVVDEILSDCLDFGRRNRRQIVKTINEMVRSQDFTNHCQLNLSSIDKLSNATNTYELDFETESLYRLHQLNALVEVLPEFQFGSESNKGLDLVVPKTPVVLTGVRIATFMPDKKGFDYPANKHVTSELSRWVRKPNKSSLASKPSRIAKLDLWETIRVEIYLSENMNYHILIHMSDGSLEPRDLSYQSTISDGGYEWSNYDAVHGEKDRIAVIKNVNTLDLFSQIEELRKWQGLEADNLYEIKQNIAKAGGHIPGAHVLI